MKVGDLCRRDVVHISAAAPVYEAARLMSERGVGTVVVTAEPIDSPIVVGMLTDRDIVRAQLDGVADLGQIRIADVMSREPLVLTEDERLDEAIRRMRARGVRRAPVIGAGGALAGVISFDDVLARLCRSLASVARLAERQSRHDDGSSAHQP